MKDTKTTNPQKKGTGKLEDITNKDYYNSLKSHGSLIAMAIVFAAICLAYSNHFSNGFHFDDVHTILNNTAIRELNIKKFFTDAATFSTLPSSQTYRPYITLENAIDYKIAGGISRQTFHLHIFIVFILTCFLFCVFVKKLLDSISFSSFNAFFGIVAAAIFGLLCANAETVNYVIQRAEIDSAMYILCGFVAFLHGGIWRKKHLYLLFPFVGFFAKEMTFVFAPLLFLYIAMFEENAYLLQFYKAEEFAKCWRAFKKTLPAFIITILFVVFYSKMQKFTADGAYGTDRFSYMITQPAVICHYIITYFVPYNLSADSDWGFYTSLSDYRAIAGIVIVCILLYIALRASKNKETRLFSFGFLWFFISLLPTSSVIPFSEALNDHRCFIPYLGLTISFVFGVKYIVDNYFYDALQQKTTRYFLLILTILYLAANAFGVHQRNKVWKDELSLWHDVAIKSPNNGRGLMNYGLALMAKGDYKNAELYFNKGLVFYPDYSALYINMAILKNSTGDKIAAENFYKRSLACTTTNHISYYYYAKFLADQGRNEEAKQNVEMALKIFPGYTDAQLLLMEIEHKLNDWAGLRKAAQNILRTAPEDSNAKKYLGIAISQKSVAAFMEEEAAKAATPQKYLDLSLKYFQIQDFEACIKAATKAIELKKDFPDAYNNIGMAYLSLKQYDKAIEAYLKALAINPNYQLAKNNLVYAVFIKGGTSSVQQSRLITADDYINLSHRLYSEKRFSDCIEAARRSIAIAPSANAYNNICSAYNELKQYDKAIPACQRALQLDRSHALAKGNLAYSLSQKNKK